MKALPLTVLLHLLHTCTHASSNDETKFCQKLNEKCSTTDNCCLGSCVGGHCNDGLFKNNKDRSTTPDRSSMIAAELSTRANIDVTDHPNIRLLPTLEECGESAPKPPHTRRKRIVGGVPYELGKYPWAVAIHLNNISSGGSGFQCGASLISRRHILTAAHCVTRIVTGIMLKWITLGNVDRRIKLDCEDPMRPKPCTPSEKQYLDVEVEDWVVHDGYSEANVRNDIAIIRLKHEVNFTDYIRPVCLPRNEKMLKGWPNSQLTVIGWGTQNTPYDITVPKLSYSAQEVEMNLVHRSNCDRFFTHMIGKLRRSQICAGGYPGRGDCAGDSGGPLFKKLPIESSVELNDNENPTFVERERYFQFGLVSTGAVSMCAREGMPSVFTNVLFYMPWILEHLIPKETLLGEKVSRENLKPVEEFATGTMPQMDVRSHRNIHLLPEYPNCGTSPGAAIVSPNLKQLNHTRVKRVVGGHTQGIGAMPWMAQIYVRHAASTELSLRCGGVLISNRYVLTGAHCVADIQGPFVLDGVLVGNTNRKFHTECIGSDCYETSIIPIEDAISHDAFSKFSREYDIALIRLSKPVQFNNFVQPICLPLQESVVAKAWPNPSKDVRYVAAGWGRVTIESGENLMSNILVAATLTLESKKYCESALTRKIGKLENKRICGGGTLTGKGECVGDTGGPMLRAVNNTDAEGRMFNRIHCFGILSVVECGNPGVPSIYQNILYFMPWILDNMEE